MAMAIYKEDIVSIELENGVIHRSFLNHSIGSGDAAANRFGIRVFRNGSEVDLSGVSCQAYFQNAEGTNIALTSYGTVSGNVAYVTLPQACYNVEGQFCLAIKLIGGGVTGTMRIIDGMVCNTGTTGAVAPTSSVPTYQEILSTYAAMVSATSAANLAIAEEFDASENYPAGKNVINDGALYVLPNGHTAGTTWANTTKVASNLGDQVTDLKSAVNHVEEKIPDGMNFPFAVVDSNGKAAITVDDDGNTSIKQKHFEQDEKGFHNKNENGDIVTDYKTSDIYDYVVCDQNNHILFYVKDGKLVIHSIETNNVDSPDIDSIEKNKKRIATSKQANFDSEINMFIAYGQSWSVGYDAAAITLASKYDNIMFNTGIKNNPLTDTETEPTSFVPMVEYAGTSNGVGTQTCGETPVSAMCNMIKQLIEEENGYVYTDFPYQMLGNAPGMGDKTLAELKKGTTWYNRLISQVEDAFTIASGLGKKLVVQAFSWQQLALGSGISTTYAEALEQLRSDIDEDVKAITGQTQDVKCITWQTFNRSATGAADCYAKYVGASETYPNIICSGASYQFKHVASDNLHLLAPDNDWAGAYFGVAYKRTIIDGEKFVPLKPIRAEIDGKDCILTFNVPQKPLVFDTDTVASIDNKGFTLLTSGGTEKTISSVSIIAPDKIKIVASDNIDSSDRIAYGQNAGTAFGPVSGNRGNVRDSQGDYITYTAGNGTVFPIHNWLVIFDKTLSTLIGG